MKVLILTLGTRGDVQPFIALARELQRRGHHAVLAAPERFADLAATYGVEFAGVDDTRYEYWIRDPPLPMLRPAASRQRWR
jgi:UDP:flavonoid glycosyltransferase YjiC (YdhE family)